LFWSAIEAGYPGQVDVSTGVGITSEVFGWLRNIYNYKRVILYGGGMQTSDLQVIKDHITHVSDFRAQSLFM
jgi:hypothetical protein